MSGLLTKNPCIDDCSFKKKLCKGCGRTKAEKQGWKQLTGAEKHAVWLRILDSHAGGGRKQGRRLLARYDKARQRAARPAADAAASR